MHLIVIIVALSAAASATPPTSALPSIIDAGRTWNAAQGLIVVATEDMRLACGFSTVLCPLGRYEDSSCLVLSIFYRGSDGGALGDRIVWAANRESPVQANSILEFGADGNLMLRDLDGTVAWSSNSSGASKLLLKKSGALVFQTSNNTEVWSSFEHPTDTLLPGQRLTQNMTLRSSVSGLNSSLGRFILALEPYQVSLNVFRFADSSGKKLPYGHWRPRSGLPANESLGTMVLQTSGEVKLFTLVNKTMIEKISLKKSLNITILYLHLDYDGAVRVAYEKSPGQPLMSFALTTGVGGNKFKIAAGAGPCGLPLRCGEYGICGYNNSRPSCDTNYLKGIVVQQDRIAKTCNTSYSTEKYTFSRLNNMDYYLTHSTKGQKVNSSSDCERLCLINCYCKMAIFRQQADKSLCFQVSEVFTLFNSSSKDTGNSSQPVAFFKEPKQKRNRSKESKTNTWIAVGLGLITVILLPFVAIYFKRIRDKHRSRDELLDNIPGLPRRFSFQELRDATGKFSTKLGSGAFGTVYRGLLEDGTKVAVKRLESSRHGCEKQFRAEVVTIASVRHANLVQLTGFCRDREHTLLVYEFMPNGSLDKWIFPQEGNVMLSWKTRLQVALDVARGLAYLHEGCDKAVLHLDIKPQNILLDTNFRSKISDFGLSVSAARGDSKSMIATVMRGTPGYMAPEWLQCKVSPKMDVYSFGMVLLELVSGRKAIEFLEAMQDEAAKHGGRCEYVVQQPLDVSEPELQSEGGGCEMGKVTQLGLCCIQEDATNRPSMGTVVKMLEGNMVIPSVAMVSFKHQAVTLPVGIASFLARGSYSADNGIVRAYEIG